MKQIHKLHIIISVILLTSLFTSCSKAIIIASDISVNSDEEEGVILYSLSLLPYDHVFNRYGIIVSNREYKKLQTPIQLTSSFDIKEDSIRVFYYAMKLPAGEYIMRGWQMDYTDVYGRLPFGRGPSSQFHIPFTIFPGRVNYIGDYMAVVTRGKNLSGSHTGFGGYFIVSDRFEKDLLTIQQKFIRLNLNKTLNCIPNFTQFNKKYTGMLVKGINVP